MTVTNRKQRTHIETGDPHWIEWVTGTVSTLLVILLIGWMAREAMTVDKEPPQLSISVDRIEAVSGLYRVDIRLQNSAGTSAAAVRIAGKLTRPDQSVEEAEVTFDYAPAQSSTKGALYFNSDPRSGTLAIAPSGFTEP